MRLGALCALRSFHRHPTRRHAARPAHGGALSTTRVCKYSLLPSGGFEAHFRQDILRLPSIQSSARAFLSLPVRKLSAPTPMVYVAQREAAFCRPGRRMMWAGSGEATTCHILAFRDAANGDSLVTHIDGSAGETRHASNVVRTLILMN